MQRRTALKNLLIIAGGTVLLPSCVHQDKKVSIPLDNLKISGDQEELLAQITETIIPTTDTPGAKALGVHQFVLIMIDDCSEKEQQDNFMKGLDEVNDLSKKHYNNSFLKCTPQQQLELLTRIDKNEFESKVNDFFKATKALTIQGYTKSKYVMTNLLVYELVPGRFHGSFPVKDQKKIVQNG
jgi:hypothetical protein